MTSKTPDEMAALKAEGGEAAVRAYLLEEQKNVFGFDHKTDPKTGLPLEQGVGSKAQPSANSVAAFERYCRDQPDFHERLAEMKADLAAYQARQASRQRA